MTRSAYRNSRPTWFRTGSGSRSKSATDSRSTGTEIAISGHRPGCGEAFEVAGGLRGVFGDQAFQFAGRVLVRGRRSSGVESEPEQAAAFGVQVPRVRDRAEPQ